MSETLSNPERAAHAALDQYMFSNPGLLPGEFELSTLEQWRRACAHAPLTPDRLLEAGWLDIEYAYALRRGVRSSDDTEMFDAVTAAITAGQEKFHAIIDNPNPHVDDLLRAHASIAQGGAGFLRSILGQELADPHIKKYLHLQAVAAREMLAHLQLTGSARAAMLADSLTVIMLFSASNLAYSPLPVPLRCLSPDIDGMHRWNALLVDRNARIAQIRIGEDGPATVVAIPASILNQHGYPSESGYGTLEAITQQQHILDTHHDGLGPAARKRIAARIEKTWAHTEPTCAAVMAAVEQQVNAPPATAESPVTDAQNWYCTLDPRRHPFIADRELLDQAMAELELQFITETITAHDALQLAFMHIEQGMGLALTPQTPATHIAGDLDRAEDILTYALEAFSVQQRRSHPYLQALLHKEALRVYRAIATRGENTQQLAAYQPALTDIAQQALALPVSTERDHLLQQLTAILLITAEGNGTYAALPSLPRQRGQNGWDISIWTQTIDGFTPARYGRLRLTEQPNQLSLSDGIVTITPHTLGQKITAQRTATLEALMGQGGRKTINRAWVKLARAVAAAEV